LQIGSYKDTCQFGNDSAEVSKNIAFLGSQFPSSSIPPTIATLSPIFV